MKTVLIFCFAFCLGSKNEFYTFKASALNGKEFDFASLKGKKVLIVNTASECGFTHQYNELQELYTLYKDKNFVIIGFPCNQFGGQEPGTEKENKEFCKKNYEVTFPIMSKVHVKGDEQAPIYKWLTTEELNGVTDCKVAWNFNKFLIDENGNFVEHLASTTEPMNEKVLKWIH